MRTPQRSAPAVASRYELSPPEGKRDHDVHKSYCQVQRPQAARHTNTSTCLRTTGLTDLPWHGRPLHVADFRAVCIFDALQHVSTGAADEMQCPVKGSSDDAVCAKFYLRVKSPWWQLHSRKDA